MAFLRGLQGNRWFKFGVVALLYVLWFVVWSGYWWAIFGVAIIFDVYISKLYYKLFWGRHIKLKETASIYKSVAGWVEAVVFAVVFASLIRGYFLEMYVIPTGSMERTLKIGDYLGVSKVTYGPKMPNTPIALPLVHNVLPWDITVKSYSEAIKLPFRRLAGLRELEREDIVVFNYPEGDTIIVDMPQSNYYQMARDYGREQIFANSDIMVHPVDRRDNYIKRAVAIYGDTLQMVDGIVYVNGKQESNIAGRQFMYNIITESGKSPFTVALVEELDLAPEDYFSTNTGFGAFLDSASAERMQAVKGVTSVTKYNASEPDKGVFPHSDAYAWNVDNIGPLWVPQAGVTVELTLENLPLYRRIISVYEGHDLVVKDGEIFIDGAKADSYTFAMNYFFMVGDNRHNSLDSRFWGFVPQDHIVGTPAFIWLSLDKNKSFPSNIRFSRIFSEIK